MGLTLLVSLLLLTLSFTCLLIHSRRRRRRSYLPPGPYPLPIIGNLLHLGRNPLRSLTKLSQTYGPLMRLKFGTREMIIVSSPDIAREILAKHENAFSSRMTTIASGVHQHCSLSVSLLPAGTTRWRMLRKICRERMFSAQQLCAGQGLRQEKLRGLADHVRGCCVDGRALDIGEAAFVTSLNLITSTLFSVDFGGYEAGSSQELMGVIRGLMRAFGSPNVADFFPVLGWFCDPQGIKKEAEFYMGRLLDKFDCIIEERLESTAVKRDDVLEGLMEMIGGHHQYHLNRDDVKHLLLDLFVAGIDTTSGTVEWIMTELLRNPIVMSQARTEIQTVTSKTRSSIEERDIANLPYLQNVIKETFRLHPPGPFLFRTCGEDDVKIDNFNIPKNAMVLINIWATGRDSRTWTNPESFVPERFLNGEIDIKGHHFELMPFGAGRRMCPGIALAHRMVNLMVATFIRDFDWELEHGLRPEDVDMDERFGLTLQKAMPLRAVPVLLA